MRIGNAPAHDHHEVEPKHQETHRCDPVLETDGLVVGGKDVFLEESRVVVIVMIVV